MENIIKVREIVEKEIKELGLEFVDMCYDEKKGKGMLQVFADKEGGLTLKDCSSAAGHLINILDSFPEMFIQPYGLEVSSPGLDRPLKTERDFLRNTGRQIKIKLSSGETFVCRISGTNSGAIICLNAAGEESRISLDEITEATVEVEF